MAGRIYAHLLTCDPIERSASDLAAELHASVGSISSMTRLLVAAELIERVSRPGMRADRYRITPELAITLMHGAVAKVTRLRRMTERGLALMQDRPPESRERLARDPRHLPVLREHHAGHGRGLGTPAKGARPVTAVITTEKLTKSYGAHRGIIDVDLEVNAGRGLRLPRAQRRRQDDDDPDPARPHPPDQRAGARLRHRVERRPGRHPPPGRLPARRVRPLRPADGRPDARVLRQPARRRRPGLPAVADRAVRPRPVAPLPRVLARATSRRSAWSSPSSTARSCSSSTSPPRASTRSSSRPSSRRCARRSTDGATVFLSSHILSEVEKSCDRVGDHPRGPDRQARHRRRPARPRPPPGGAAVRRPGPGRRVRGAARRERRRGRRPRPADARRRRRSRRSSRRPRATSCSTSSRASRRSRRRSWPSTAARPSR